MQLSPSDLGKEGYDIGDGLSLDTNRLVDGVIQVDVRKLACGLLRHIHFYHGLFGVTGCSIEV